MLTCCQGTQLGVPRLVDAAIHGISVARRVAEKSACGSSGRILTSHQHGLEMTSPLDKAARLSRNIQGKLGEKLALLYVPVLRQRLPHRLSELLDRMDVSEKPRDADLFTYVKRLGSKIRRKN